MKKYFFFVSAVMTLAMGAMFVSCEDDDPESCTCTIEGTEDGEHFKETETISGEDLAEALEEYNAKSCKELGKKGQEEAKKEGEDVKISCK